MTFNLTLGQSYLGKSYWPPIDTPDYKTYEENDQINLFNENNYHLSLNNMLTCLIFRNFHVLSMIFKDAIENSMRINSLAFIITISIYLAIVTIGYVFFWLPFAQKLNRTVSIKTKQTIMLSFRYTKQRICYQLFLRKY